MKRNFYFASLPLSVLKRLVALCFSFFFISFLYASVPSHGSIRGEGIELYQTYGTGVLNPDTKREGVTVDYKVVTIGSKSWAWTDLSGGTIGGADWESQLRYRSGESFNDFTENKLEKIISGTQQRYSSTIATIPNPLKISIFQSVGGNSETDKISYDITKLNSADEADESAPSITSAAVSEATEFTAKLELSGNDDSGHFFYYIYGGGVGEVSFVSSFVLENLKPSTSYSLSITPVDFSGNEGLPQTVTFTTKDIEGLTYPQAGKLYKIKHYDSAPEVYIGRDNSDWPIAQDFTGEDQLFFILKMDNDSEEYNIQQFSTGDYMANRGVALWESKYTNSYEEDISKFYFEADLTGYIYIKCKTMPNNYIGINNNEDSRIFFNKNKEALSRFVFEEVLLTNTQKQVVLESLLEQVNNVLAIDAQFGAVETQEINDIKSALELYLGDLDSLQEGDALNNLIRDTNASVKAYKASMTKPEVGKLYKIRHVDSPNSQYIGRDGDRAVIQPYVDDNQVFVILKMNPEAEEYNLQQLSTQEYVANETAGSWQNKYNKNFDGDISKFTFVYDDAGYYYIKCKTNNYLGADNTNLNQNISFDKPKQGNGYTTFRFEEVTPTNAQKRKVLQPLLDKVDAVFTKGGTSGESETLSLTNVKETLESHLVALNYSPVGAALNNLIVDVYAKIDAYNDLWQAPVFSPEATELYRITSQAGGYLDNEADDIQKVATSESSTQLYEFVSSVVGENQVYSIKTQTGKYIYATVSDVKAKDTVGDDCYWSMAHSETANGIDYYTFLNVSQNKYLVFYLNEERAGCADAIADASKIAIIKEGTVFTEELESSIGTAQAFYNTTVEGTEGGKYPAEARAVFAAAIQDAVDVLNGEGLTQTIVDNAKVALDAALSAYRASIIVPEFTPAAGEKYRIMMNLQKRYIVYNSDATNLFTGQLYSQGDDKQFWEFQSVEGKDGFFYIHQGDKYLQQSHAMGFGFSMEDKNEGEFKQHFTIRYVKTTDDSRHLYAIYGKEGEADTRSNYLFTLQQNNGDYRLAMGLNTIYPSQNESEWLELIKIDLPYDPNKVLLGESISESKIMLNNAVLGNSIGQYQEYDYNAFKTILDGTEVIYNKDGYSQAEVDNALEKLITAREVFENSANDNYSAFCTQLQAARDKLAATCVGEQTGECYQTIIDDFIVALKAAELVEKHGTTVTKAERNALTLAVATFNVRINTSTQSIQQVLDDAILSAEKLIASSEIGEDGGQYSEENVELFRTAINAAKAANPVSRADLDILTQARATFESSANTVYKSVWVGADNNWNNPANWTLNQVPDADTDVYIPGNVLNYPMLTGEKENNVCHNIYFMHGGELGRPDLLTYEKAHVQINFGLENPNSIQQKSNTLSDHLAFSAQKSASALSRNKWHMLSLPLKKVVSGDFSFGGYPGTFLRKFDASKEASGTIFRANWSDYFTSSVEEFTAGEGVIVWMNKYQANKPYFEFGEGIDSPISDESRKYGLQQTNGIMELPYFENEDMSRAHRIHTYDKGATTSTFNGFRGGDSSYPDYLEVTRNTESYNRGSSNEAYRFIFENSGGSPNVTYPVKFGTTDDSEIALIGNPYMSTIDFDNLYQDNEGVIKKCYHLWVDNAFVTYGVGGFSGVINQEITTDKYIAPMQAFLVEKSSQAIVSDEYDVEFNVENISTIRPSGSNSRLRSNSYEVDNESDKLDIIASNDAGAVLTFIARREGGQSVFSDYDSRKIISGIKSLPEVYSVKNHTNGKIGVGNNIIGTDRITIPIGLATSWSGEITLTFRGMERYDADITFIDTQKNSSINLSNYSEYDYSFDYQPARDAQNAIIPSEDRFFVLISPKRVTADEDALSGQLSVYTGADAIHVISNDSNPIKQLYIYDMQGRIMYTRDNVNMSYCTIPMPDRLSAVGLIKVITEKEVKNIKLLNK
ncbi:hypothetical protein D0T49_04650 [Paludibacter sp. 221]|uniref:hypothetical protein n=1 Tax=Paludibacter sp. 221 TaxID=2302939 RepID=UPI0013D7103F|nr:hypothetical protein [Paludibacter sp. 221]NDV46327.1 hypothetical protein [Paludibacter sp. 221]